MLMSIMSPTFVYLPSIRLTLYVCIYFLTCVNILHCNNSSDTTTSSVQGNCFVLTTTLSLHQGYPTGETCTTTSGNASKCSILCGAQPKCKLVYATSCSANVQCSCSYCNQLADVDFSLTNFTFYLQTNEMEATTGYTRVFLTGGIVAGQPVVTRVTLIEPITSLKFFSKRTDQAFALRFLFIPKIVVATSYLNKTWGPKDTTTPHFNFTGGQEVSVFYVITYEAYYVYVDQVLFKRFEHVVPLASITRFELISVDRQATILSFRR
ncbi:hypothetical protein ElyMa_000372100 [Elysia marginata]|uniref:Galectin n=1 Tax=Elysia marginata TaxID=1093978 RepID=A0AAV4FGI8_9GAST|nr:hypothetical protein ElyMa_000372100 [Elysia marginata]